MWNGTKVVDVHGHISRPPQVRQFAAGLMSNRTPGKMNIPDDVTEPAFQRHIADMDDRLIDFQLVGPRPVDQWHWMPMFLQQSWARATNDHIAQSVRLHPDRFAGAYTVDPNEGVPALRKLEQAVRELGVKAASVTPAFVHPQVPINDKRAYPVYAKCVELDIAVTVTTGVPGPRVPMQAQDVALIDEVCWFFPELRFVMRHGGEPWTALAVKLLLKWPNLYYSTSAFAPRHYPQDIIDFANTRGADKIIYAGYFPMGLSLERIMTDLPQVPFRDHVWPKFLRENAARVLKIN